MVNIPRQAGSTPNSIWITTLQPNFILGTFPSKSSFVLFGGGALFDPIKRNLDFTFYLNWHRNGLVSRTGGRN